MSADKNCENHLRKSAMRSIRVICVLIFVRSASCRSCRLLRNARAQRIHPSMGGDAIILSCTSTPSRHLALYYLATLTTFIGVEEGARSVRNVRGEAL